MKSLLCILLFSLIFNACCESLCDEPGSEEINKAENPKMIDHQPNKKHAITESKCHLLNEWLNRKSMGHFLKNHISLESGISCINEKTLFNDTFIP
ncbi:hypothetical protein [Daejeonella sp.]|uniref:hypothetical protein n=1 Tax=Daejeonella sp. TaxID=2805397 RepID=UPI002731E347|nr:hypothetical protein [Daejeonella sp.]MDP2413734.1 hypothetical protein [Daejeonella sp.]